MRAAAITTSVRHIKGALLFIRSCALAFVGTMLKSCSAAMLNTASYVSALRCTSPELNALQLANCPAILELAASVA